MENLVKTERKKRLLSEPHSNHILIIYILICAVVFLQLLDILHWLIAGYIIILSVLYVWNNVIHNGYTHTVNVAYLETSLGCQSSCTGTVSDFLTKDVIAQVLGCTYAVNISVYLLWLF